MKEDYNLNKDSKILIKDRTFMLSNMTKAFNFKRWYDDIQVSVLKYVILEKYLEYFSRACWYALLKKTQKGEIGQAVERIYKYYMGKQPLIDSINQELDNREEKRIQKEQELKNKEVLLRVLESNIKDGLVSFSTRELDCLYYLIESGTISTYSELMKYGIKF